MLNLFEVKLEEEYDLCLEKYKDYLESILIKFPSIIDYSMDIII